jgi:hypothetical protein
MAERIDDIISKEAFDQVAKMDKGLSELLKRFEGNANAVKLFNAALQGSDKMSQVTATIKQAATETAKLEAAQRQLAFANSEQGKELALLKVQIEENTRANKNAAKEMLATEGSVKQMNAQLIRLRGQWDNMSEALRKSPMGADLAKRINLVDTALKTLDSNTGRFQRNVGNYATATNSLSQVLREMPAFTYSASTGILALSNNLPILVDQFKAVKAETGSTAKALSVFGSSIFSATNLLTIAIGVITVVAGRMAMMADKTKEVKDAFDEALKSGAKEVSQMQALYSLATDVTASYQARKDAVDKLQQQYPDYLGNLSDEAIMAGNAADAYNALNEALINNSIYKAFQAQADEVASSLPTLYNQLNNLRKQQQQIMAAGPQTVSTYSGGVPSGVQTVANSPLLLVQNEITATQKAIDATKEQMRQLLLTANQFANSLSNRGGTSGAGAGGGRTTGGGRTGQSAAGQQSVGMDDLSGDALAGAGAGSTLGWLSALTVTPGSPQEEELDKSAETLKKYFEKINDDMAAAFDDADREKMLGIKNTTDATKLAQEIQTETERKGAAERKKIKKEEEHQKRITVLENVAQMVKMAAEIMSIAADIDFQREMAQIEQRDKALSESYDKELKAIELSGKSKAQQEVDKRRLEAQTEAQRKRIDRDRIKAARKKAQSDKASDIANIITGTASAVVAALGAKPYGPQNIALASFTGAIGLANLARAAAAPLPQFAKGTNSAPGGLAVVSERGQELVIEPSGKKYLTPATESIINLPKGSKVIPNDELMKSVEQATMIKLGQGGAVTSQQYGDVMVEIFEQTLEENRKLRRVLEDKKMSVVINNNSEFDNWTKKYVK